MPAPFIAQLCGFRGGRPNTSDAHDAQSVELGHALFARLGIDPATPGPESHGTLMEVAIVQDLRERRPDLYIDRSQHAARFDQFEHLKQSSSGKRSMLDAGDSDLFTEILTALDAGAGQAALGVRVRELRDRVDASAAALQQLIENLPAESMLKLDIVVASDEPPSELFIALSSKWSLRTDRAQDCISQGNKLVGLRRGRMPHYATITMEPRPAMLRLLADGSGSLDCVYHLDLPNLRLAVEDLETTRSNTKGRRVEWSPRATLERLVRQRRVRDYDDLVHEVMRASA